MIQSGDVQPQIEPSPINQDGADGAINNTEKISTNVHAANELADEEGSIAERGEKRPLNFYLAFLAINIVVFIFSLDSTGLSVAIPVRNS